MSELDGCPPCEAWAWKNAVDTLAARLAKVEALADEWEADPDGLPRAGGCARLLRAALESA